MYLLAVATWSVTQQRLKKVNTKYESDKKNYSHIAENFIYGTKNKSLIANMRRTKKRLYMRE